MAYLQNGIGLLPLSLRPPWSESLDKPLDSAAIPCAASYAPCVIILRTEESYFNGVSSRIYVIVDH